MEADSIAAALRNAAINSAGASVLSHGSVFERHVAQQTK